MMYMRKVTKYMTAAVLCVLACLFVLPAYAETEGDYTYTVSYNNATITGYTGAETALIVPDTLGGYPVTAIGNRAFYNLQSLTSIVLPDAVESIGSDAFNYCQALESIDLPQSLVSLGTYAFNYCFALTSVDIPSGVTKIPNNAFSGCSSLAHVSLPDGLTTLGQGAFSNCSVLTDIRIPQSVTTIENAVFRECKALREIVIPEGVDAINYRLFYNCNSLTSVSIPDSITSIAAEAFYNCSNLTAVSVPEAVTEIGKYAFYNCSKLTEFVLPDGIASIGYAYESSKHNSAFTNCSAALYANAYSTTAVSLTGATLAFHALDYPELTLKAYETDGVRTFTITSCDTSVVSITLPEETTVIGSSAFSGCSSLQSIVLPAGVTTINIAAFYGCSSLQSVNLPDGISNIPARTFYNCKKLSALNIPDSVTTLGEDAFYGCYAAVTLPNDISSISYSASPKKSAFNSFYGIVYADMFSTTALTLSSASVTFRDPVQPSLALSALEVSGALRIYVLDCDKTAVQITIPEGVTAISSSAFADCTALTSVTIPDTVTGLANAAFSGCSSLTSITLPSGVTNIPSNAFKNCTSLTSVTLPDGIDIINDNAFYNCTQLNQISLPSSLISISTSAFASCNSLDMLVIPDTLKYVYSSSFSNCPAKLVADTDSAAALVLSKAGCTFTPSDYPYLRLKAYETDGVRTFAVAGCDTNVVQIALPEHTTQILNGAFSGCYLLREFVIPEGVISIGNEAFYACTQLQKVVIPEGVTSIGEYAFFSCSQLSSVSLPQSLASIGAHAFRLCSSLSSVAIPNGVTAIEPYTFALCSSLSQISLPDGLVSIGNYAFENTVSLENLVLPANIETISSYAFSGCKFLPYAQMDSRTAAALTTAGYGFYASGYPGVLLRATDSTDGIRTVTFASYTCADTAIVIPEGVDTIAASALSGNIAITRVTMPNSITTIGKEAFKGCSSLTDIYLSENITSVGTNAFYGCPAKLHASRLSATALLLSVTDPEYPQLRIKAFETDGVRTYAIDSCEKTAVNISFPEDTTTIASSAFSGCTALESIVIPEGVTLIERYAFSGCTALRSVSLPSSLTKLDTYVFNNCSALETVRIHEDAPLTALSQYLFSGCSAFNALYLPDHITSIDIYSFGSDLYPHRPTFYADPYSTTALTLAGRGYSFTPVQQPGVLLKAAETDGVRSFTVTGSFENIVDAYIPEGTTTISSRAFEDRTSLRSVSIPEGVTQIGSSAFFGCSSLQTISLPDSVTTLGSSVFYGCSSLMSARLSDNVSALSYYAFYGCSSLTEIIFPQNLTSIGDYSFSGCSALAQVNLPQSLAAIGNYAFSGCTPLAQITLPQNLTSLGGNAFSGCTLLTSLSIPDGLTSCGYNDVILYANPYSPAAVAISAANQKFCRPGYEDYKLTAQDDNNNTRIITLAACTVQDRTQVVIPEGIHSVGEYVFSNWAELTHITFPEGFTTLGHHALYNCAALESVSLPSTLRTIGSQVFCSNDSLAELVIPDGVTTIESNAFIYCDSILWINLNTPTMTAFAATTTAFRSPEYPLLSFKSIADESGSVTLSVSDCDESANYVTLPQNVTALGKYAFAHCDNLRMLDLPDSVISISEDAFSSCDNLVSLTIPDGVTQLPSGMADHCSSLTSAVIPASVTSIASTAFYSKLATVFCHRGSYADTWAQSTGRNIVYLDDVDLEDYMYLSGETALARDHGQTLNWRGLVALAPLPQNGSYTLRCVSSDPSVASVSGDTVSVLKAGTAKLTVTVDELPWLSHMITLNAYNPVESFTLPTAVFMPAGGSYEDRVTLRPQIVSPENTNPMYSWTENGSSWSSEYETRTYWPQSSSYVTTVTVTSQSGVSRTCKVVTYQSIGNLRFKELGKRLEIGAVVSPGVILFVDGVAYVDEPALYTLSSSDESVAKPAANGKLEITGIGTATITVTALGGQTAQQTITVTGIRVMTLPVSLREILSEAFAASSAQVVIIPEGCVSIGSRAFANCADLIEITIPASVTDIAADAFSGCSGLTVIAPAGSAAQAMAEDMGFVWQTM